DQINREADSSFYPENMATAARLLQSPHRKSPPFFSSATPIVSFPHHSSPSPLRTDLILPNSQLQTVHFSSSAVAGGGSSTGNGIGSRGGGGGGRGGGGESSDDGMSSSSSSSWVGPVGAFLNGWRSRVAADPQFPFKVLMEELVGVSACVLGDMASRPNFGLNELDFVFSTLVVGCIPQRSPLQPPPSLQSSSIAPTSHMFESGPYTLFHRLGTFVYKGVLFAAVGFAAGLVGTAISNSLIKMRKKMDPSFETPNKPPPTLLNAATWAIHMGVSSNFRYQTLNGIEFMLERSSVVVLRCLNNVLGGMTFVILARLTGSQSVGEAKQVTSVADDDEEKKQLCSLQGFMLQNLDIANKKNTLIIKRYWYPLPFCERGLGNGAPSQYRSPPLVRGVGTIEFSHDKKSCFET
ncbi:unnamed protein product, partial [Thlaspi arvense]